LGRRAEEVNKIKNRLLDAGATGAVMSGTGSAVFGLFENEQEAGFARDELSKICREAFLTRTRGAIIL
jgi:4-diphosphocytidyl-2-C-methyl-D-erythritol kinase